MTNGPIALYLVRHGIAAEPGEEFPDDSKRPLTERGIKRFRQVARGLADMGVEVDVILSSPLVRARQTADILSHALPGHPSVVQTSALLPGAEFSELSAELARYGQAAAIAMTGHQPSIGAFAARLVGCRGDFDVKKGGVCRIDVERLPPSAPGRLRWFAPPKLIAALRG